jgi:hypothetical protein
MDTLENIGERQIYQNRVFADYRKMVQGRLVYTDFTPDQAELSGIANFRQEQAELPTFLKHYDLIGGIIRLLAGEYNKQKDTLRVDSTDLFSESEYFRERDSRIREYTEQYFDLEIRMGLMERGMDPDKQDFESEEQQQQYMQMLQAESSKLVNPSVIEKEMKKSFKTIIVEWAEKTLESNYVKFRLDMLDTTELKDFLATGRYFRHYHVGHDNYRPETWDLERTFFSQDLDALYPQDCEYVGNINYYSASEILNKFGHLIPHDIQTKLYGKFNHQGYTSNSERKGPMDFLKAGGTTAAMVPYASYFQKQTAEGVQDALGVPWGKQYFKDEDGEIDMRYNWIRPTQGSGLFSPRMFRDDVQTRTDSIQLTEAYFKSKKLIILLTLENPISNKPFQEIVTEDILGDYLKAFNIKKITNKTMKEVTENPSEYVNTAVWGYVPEVWKGFKLRSNNTSLKEDFYFNINPLEYQLRGDSNDFDVKIPVAGIIASGMGEIIRSFQIRYNIAMNRQTQLLEKTLGTFFMMDFNLLPSQFKGEDGKTTAEMLEEWRETVRELGIGLVDQSPQNTKGLNPNQNNFQMYDMSYVNEMRMYMEIAQDAKRQAYEIIGITDQRRGSPNEYETAEGVKQGSNASYAQTEIWYKMFNTAKAKEKEIELGIAQYAVTDNKDISLNYMNPQSEMIVKKFTDKDFHLRKINVYPSDDSGKRKELDTLKNFMLQNNTMDSDIYDLAKIVTSDNFTTLIEFGMNKKKEKQADMQSTREYEQSMLEKNIEGNREAAIQIQKDKMEIEKLKSDTDIETARIRANAILADSNMEPKYVESMLRANDSIAKGNRDNRKLDIAEKDSEVKAQKYQQDSSNAMSKMALEFQKLNESRLDRNLRQKEMNSRETVAIINPG